MKEEVAPNPRLFIGGLAWAATDEDLVAAFSPFGEIKEARVAKYPDTGRSKGFAFVEFSTTEEAEEAKAKMNEQEIVGRKVIVDFARPKKEREEA